MIGLWRNSLFIGAAFLASIIIVNASTIAGGLFIGMTSLLLMALITPITTLAILLVVAPMKVLIATESPSQVPGDVGQIALIIFLALWITHRIAWEKRLPRFASSKIYIPVGVFVSVLGLTAFSAISVTVWMQEWIKWIQILLLIAVIASLVHQTQWWYIPYILAIAGIANALVGLYEFFGGSGALHLLINGRYFRAFGTFGQPNPFGGFMGMLSPLMLMTAFGYGWAFCQTWLQNQRFDLKMLLLTAFYASSAALLIVGVFISWSRGAWLGLIGALGVITISLPKKLWQSIGLLVSGIALLIVMWTMDLLPSSIQSRLNSITIEAFTFNDVRGVDITPANYAIVERLAHWQAALRMATENPILGVGAGNYEVAYEMHRLINWDEPLGHAHNYYLNILAEGGILGFVSYLAMWIGIFYLTWQTRQHPDPLARSVAVGLLGSWTYLSIHSLTDNLFVNNLFLHIGVMLGLLAILYRETHTGVVMEH